MHKAHPSEVSLACYKKNGYFIIFYRSCLQASSSGPYKAVIFLSFDGLHQFDVVDYIAEYPKSTLASIVKNSVVYSNARASSPSDSFPATTALFTGASPRDSGIWWDDVYDRSLYPPASNCTGPIGTECDWSEADDLNSTLITGGGSFNSSKLPLQKTAWGSCEVVYPHNFIRVNTVFEVGRENGLQTAYADKHTSYEFLNGPSGVGLSQGYFPEIASVKNTITAQEAWDDLHWSALANWTSGLYTNGTKNPDGAPALMGANFQAITWGQTDGGYLNANGSQPNRTLASALNHTDLRLGQFISHLEAIGMMNTTLLLLGSKQGQGPINAANLTEFDQSNVVAAAKVPVAFFTGDDGGIMWLKNQSQAAEAKANLLANTTVGVLNVLAGNEVQLAGYGSPYLDSRVPDLVIGAKVGYLWAHSQRFEDHGGFLPQDLNVPLIAYNPKLKAKNITSIVSNRQVATTLLQALGLPLSQLDSYRNEGTPSLPHLFKGINAL